MATLVLTAAGTLFGGPVGGAIGSLIGQQIDGRLLKPGARHGPRLGDLSVQTSSYGTPIPKIFGKMRVAGTVIWSTDLQEKSSRTGGGKGQPSIVSYTYSASFAVALSGRSIQSVRRIWADGKLLRGLAGDFKTRTKFRLYTGGEDQAVDPIIASDVGLGSCPAHRGIAYAVFEDFELGEYGNRIPSLTFEVVAEEAPVTIGKIADELSQGAIKDGGSPTVAGYAASGDSVRGALEILTSIMPVQLTDNGMVLSLKVGGGTAVLLPAETAGGARSGGSAGGRNEYTRRAADLVPAEVSISYYDPARDYQVGLQRARQTQRTPIAEQVALPAALSAAEAKALAERRLATLWAERSFATINLPWRHVTLAEGNCVEIPGRSGIWRIKRKSIEQMVVSLELTKERGGEPLDAPPATPGSGVQEPDLTHGPTKLELFELPWSGGGQSGQMTVFAAVAGAEPGWRRAALEVSEDGGTGWVAAGSTAAPMMMGNVISGLPASTSSLWDEKNSVEVELLNETMWLEGRSDDDLVAGANLALLGDELVQFGMVQPIGTNRFRLSRLLRGRRGTEWAMSAHSIGERFILIDAGKLVPIPVQSLGINSQIKVSAAGIADVDAVTASHNLSGLNLRPPSPVHLNARGARGSDIIISWVRRSRNGWGWSSEGDTPLGEEREAYRLTMTGTGFSRTIDMDQPAFTYSAAQQTADSVSGPISIFVEQVGTFALSRPAGPIII